MSETASSKTKTISETEDSDSVDVPLVPDRWSNNITYEHLVMSTCIGITQVWWHPYIHDLPRLIPFLCLSNLFGLLVAYPMFYLELALGAVTKKGVLNCWDLAPVIRGVGLTMLTTCSFTALALGVVSAYSLASFVHSFHSFLPWLHCAAASQPACAARHRPMAVGSDTPAQSYFFNLVLNLRRDGLESGLGKIVWELTTYYIISWIIIYFIAIKRLYSYSKLVLFKDVLAYFTLVCTVVGAARLEGATRMFRDCDWSTLFDGFEMWRDALETSLLQMSVSSGTVIMLGSYFPKERCRLGYTATVTFVMSKVIWVFSALALGAVHGALKNDYDGYTNVWSGASSSMVLWADYVARVPGSQAWSALVHFTLFVLAVTSTALLVQTIMSTFTGKSLRKMSWAFLVFICMMYCFIGIITLCTQSGLYVVNFLLEWAATRPRVPAAAAVAAVGTYVYGQTTLCEDVFFAVGEYPCAFFRVVWAIMPAFCILIFLTGVNGKSQEAGAGWTLVMFSLLPIAIVATIYIVFKFRVRNIVANEK